MRSLTICRSEKGEVKIAQFGKTDERSIQVEIDQFTAFVSDHKKLDGLKKALTYVGFWTEKTQGGFLKSLMVGNKTAVEHYEKYLDPEIGVGILEAVLGVKKEIKLYGYANKADDFMFTDIVFTIDFSKNKAYYKTGGENHEYSIEQ